MTRSTMGYRLLAVGVALAAIVAAPVAWAQTRGLTQVTVEGASANPIPIAVTDFVGDATGVQISQVIAADLERSGLFRPIDRGAFIERITDPGRAPRFQDWRAINADALVVGSAT